MSRHATFRVVVEDCTSDGRKFRVRRYVQAASAEDARRSVGAVKIVGFKEMR